MHDIPLLRQHTQKTSVNFNFGQKFRKKQKQQKLKRKNVPMLALLRQELVVLHIYSTIYKNLSLHESFQ